MSPVRPEDFDKHLKIIRDSRGDDAIHSGSEQVPVDRIPLDSPGLMRITGGGIPLGHMTRLWGPPSSGKSLVLWMIFAAAQRLLTKRFPNGLETCYWNVEKQYDREFTKARGVDVDRMKVEQNQVIEDIGAELELLLGSIHVHAIDSCSSATSQDELAAEIGDWFQALDAKVWKKVLKRVLKAMDKDENAVIYVDHESREFKTNRAKAPGGKDMEHNSSMSLHFKQGRWLYYDNEGLLQPEDKMKEKSKLGIAGQKEADGQEIHVRCNKSRVCRPLRVATMRLDLNTFKFDTVYELMEGGLHFDRFGTIAHHSGQPAIITGGGKGGWYTINDGVERKKAMQVQGDRGLRLLIGADPDLQKTIMDAMMGGF